MFFYLPEFSQSSHVEKKNVFLMRSGSPEGWDLASFFLYIPQGSAQICHLFVLTSRSPLGIPQPFPTLQVHGLSRVSVQPWGIHACSRLRG